MPRETTPMAKAITTLEGQLVLVTNVVIGAGATIDPGRLSPKIAAIVAGAMNISLIVQRLILKVQASKVQAVVMATTDTMPLTSVKGDIQFVERAAEKLADPTAKPGMDTPLP